jgi:hypothetical protein
MSAVVLEAEIDIKRSPEDVFYYCREPERPC